MNLAALKRTSTIFEARHREYVRQIRGTLLRGLSGPSLASALDSFDRGDLRQAALLWEAMAQRDDIISVVKPKREKAVSRRDWQVIAADDSAEAAKQKKVLEAFWNNIRAVNAYDLNDRGGISKLIRQMMTATSFRYAVHHMVWQPSSSGLACTFEFVPLSFFENQTGRLRFCRTGLEYSGADMPDNEWMVTVGDGLMMAGSIGYLCKRNSLADWLAFSDKFGTPGILGRTSQAKDSPGGQAMLEAVETFGQDWDAVIFGDDQSGKIELIQASGSSSTLPFPNLIERVDRRLAALWRGADLGTMSSRDGEGSGASLQQSETDLIEQDDALTVSEKLNEIDELVLRWWFGPRVKPRAYFRLIVPQRQDLQLLLQSVELLVQQGAPLAVDDILERFGFGRPKAGAELLGQARAAARPEINAERAEEQFLAEAGKLLAKAAREDREDLAEELREVLAANDGERIQKLAAFMGRLPEQIGQDAAQVRAWETLLATALANGWATGAPDETEDDDA